MDNYVYVLDGVAYINLTNRCQNNCKFCIRTTDDCIAGTKLWIAKEPSADDIIAAYAAAKYRLTSDEVVFCGYGEPTEALDVLIECAKRFKTMGLRTRLNTNGLGGMSAGRNIAPELKDCIDRVSVSLNQFDERSYLAITSSRYGIAAFSAVLDFIRDCKAEDIDVTVTVVDVISKDDEEKCRKLAARLGVPLRVREYIGDNYASHVTESGK
ncbi:MAG: TatD family nuclease-associated radical SAM protein [Roseburia sp.]|nr:TatD family nuclease-associated radical SAM protein [Roseburia sp.]